MLFSDLDVPTKRRSPHKNVARGSDLRYCKSVLNNNIGSLHTCRCFLWQALCKRDYSCHIDVSRLKSEVVSSKFVRPPRVIAEFRGKSDVAPLFRFPIHINPLTIFSREVSVICW